MLIRCCLVCGSQHSPVDSICITIIEPTGKSIIRKSACNHKGQPSTVWSDFSYCTAVGNSFGFVFNFYKTLHFYSLGSFIMIIIWHSLPATEIGIKPFLCFTTCSFLMISLQTIHRPRSFIYLSDCAHV